MSLDEASTRWAGMAVPCAGNTAALHRPRASTDTARDGRSDPVSSSRHRKVTRVRLLPFCEGLHNCCLCLRTPGRRRVDVEGEQIVGADLPCALSENGKPRRRPVPDPGLQNDPPPCHSEKRPHSTGEAFIRPLSGRDKHNDKHDRPPIERGRDMLANATRQLPRGCGQ